MVETPQQHRWIDTIVFWLLGGALYVAIALLPAILMGYFFFGGVIVHAIVVPTSFFIFLLLWVASAFTLPQSRR